MAVATTSRFWRERRAVLSAGRPDAFIACP
jgi:hypothetical protein